MEYPRCRTCKWYEVGTAKDCSCPKWVFSYSTSAPVDVDGIQVEIDEGWGAHMEPGFGCVHHTEKEAGCSP